LQAADRGDKISYRQERMDTAWDRTSNKSTHPETSHELAREGAIRRYSTTSTELLMVCQSWETPNTPPPPTLLSYSNTICFPWLPISNLVPEGGGGGVGDHLYSIHVCTYM
jgi:hypothetical protein